jgi:protoporphyrinogen oxidase
MQELAPARKYHRRSAVYFLREGRRVPYPLQYHLSYLDKDTAGQAVEEMGAPLTGSPVSMAEWLEARFGPGLTQKFFGPFHERYTAGLWREIVPQDNYKSPVDMALVRRGAAERRTVDAGYNAAFLYPETGLDGLADAMADQCDIRFNRRVVEINTRQRVLAFADGGKAGYDRLLSTLPLNRMIELSGIQTEQPQDPYTSVLVLNIGAIRGPRCPDDHWLYVPDAESGFFRVGFYSNVDRAFLPASARTGTAVSLYVERACPGGQRPGTRETEDYIRAVVTELQQAGFICEVEALDPTWIDVAYTWSRTDSQWPRQAIKELESRGIFMAGRYGRWRFQGIAASIREGLAAGTALQSRT